MGRQREVRAVYRAMPKVEREGSTEDRGGGGRRKYHDSERLDAGVYGSDGVYTWVG